MMTTPARPFDVLLVEDDIADAMLIEEALSERGARNLVQVTDGVAALEHLRTPGTPRPDLIVLDLNMPRMNGRDLLKVLKADEDLQTIPVVVLTTSTAPEDVTGAYSSHANAYVTKPVNLEEFETAVQSIDAFYLDAPPRGPVPEPATGPLNRLPALRGRWSARQVPGEHRDELVLEPRPVDVARPRHHLVHHHLHRGDDEPGGDVDVTTRTSGWLRSSRWA